MIQLLGKRQNETRFIFYSEDDKLGQVYVDVTDFVDKNQHFTATLPKKGYVILETVIPVVTPAPQNTPVPVLPPITTPKPQQILQATPNVTNVNAPAKLQFKLSAKDLANKDKTGASDPYVELYYTEGESSKQKKLGVSSTIQDNNNPVWKDTFEFQYDPSKNQVEQLCKNLQKN